MATKAVRNERKICGLCNAFVNEDQYRAHVAKCGLPDKDNDVLDIKKVCPLCERQVKDLAEHFRICTGGEQNTNAKHEQAQIKTRKSGSHRANTKQCIICDAMILEDDYTHHVSRCMPPQISNERTEKKNVKECIICYKNIPEPDYAVHVDACLSGSFSSSKPKPKPKTRGNEISCFTCSSMISMSNNSGHVIPCRSNHIYCIKCLKSSMNQYIKSKSVPVCHATLCDYELSRYDVACLPIETSTIEHLFNCVKTPRKPQCPICSFYIDFNTMDDFQKHVASCNSENLIPCEYCHCLYNTYRLDNHARQCRNTPHSQQLQALIDFIVPRTKYPSTAQEIRVFIDHRKGTRSSIEPHAIISALAELEGVFPFEIPTLDCGVCMDTCMYDDIFVFDCKENHKLCYGCFENSCTSKMNNNEMLTCGLCSYQLQEGEIKQLRIPEDRKRQILDYHIQKTFSSCVASSQGIIKCPNGNCNWIAEAQNPSDRFQVTCPLCKYIFCSLCNRQYHFRTTCQQIPNITQRWFFWCDTERGRYWQTRAQQDAQFQAQLEDYERQRVANTQRNQELAQRYNELLADETYKAQNCRLCPHCQRVVQHLGGCDLMICGRNYHGGDDQSGCGKNFKFSQALPYVPLANTGPQQVRNDLPPPEEQKLVIHEGVQCDACHQQVQGIRFDCIHCASLIFCEKCEQRSTLEHSNQNRKQQKQQHVFLLITQPLN